MEALREKRVHAVFYRTESGNEPVKEELLKLGRPTKTIIGEDVKFVELNWKLDRPYVDQLRKGHGSSERTIYEVRSRVFDGSSSKEYRVLFFIFDELMVLTHIFEKKTRSAPSKEINVAWERMKRWLREQKENHEKK